MWSPLQTTRSGENISFIIWTKGSVTGFSRCWKSVKATKLQGPFCPAVLNCRASVSVLPATIL